MKHFHFLLFIFVLSFFNSSAQNTGTIKVKKPSGDGKEVKLPDTLLFDTLELKGKYKNNIKLQNGYFNSGKTKGSYSIVKVLVNGNEYNIEHPGPMIEVKLRYYISRKGQPYDVKIIYWHKGSCKVLNPGEI